MPWVCATLFFALQFLLPFAAQRLSQAEPSFAGEIFSWLPKFTKESLTAARSGAGEWTLAAPFISVCVALFAIYAKMFRAMRGVQSLAVQRLVFGAGAAAFLVHVFSPVMLSSDVFAYAMYGRATSVYGGNPYSATMPVPDTDPFYIHFGEEYLPSWYGPVWTFVSAAATRFTGEHVGLTVLVFRLIAIACALAASGFIWSSLRKSSPENATRGLVLFLWNPLVTLETGMSAHNDATMLALVTCGVWLHLRGQRAGAVVALTLSALVKFLTGMLVPLYVLLVLRETTTWRARAAFLARSLIPAGAIAVVAFHLAKADADVPVAHSATAPDFYLNNFHELIFHRLRVAVGEDADSAKVAVQFYPYWIRLRTAADLLREKSASAPRIRAVSAGEDVLLIAPEKSPWPRIYDPTTHQRGYLDGGDFTETERPPSADDDPLARELDKPVVEHATVRRANAIIRIVTWLGFAAFGLFAAWRTRSFTEFLVWSGASLLASYFFIITEIWPWYMTWALALGALAPGRMPARFAMILSAGALTLYVTLGFEGKMPASIFPLRSLFAFVLPLLIFGGSWTLRRRRRGFAAPG